MNEIIRTDLSQEVATERADLQLAREQCEAEVTLPGVGARFGAKVLSGSPMAISASAAILILAGCVAMGTAAAVSAPGWLLASSLFVPAAIFLVIFAVVHIGHERG